MKITMRLFRQVLMKIFRNSAFQIKIALSTAMADIVTIDMTPKNPWKNPVISQTKQKKAFGP